jgi:uncharacterized OB-fold protein
MAEEARPASYPLPQPSPESGPFWEACARRELTLQRCGGCGRFWFPPAGFCPECWSTEWSWQPVAGRGRIHSFVVYRRAYHPAFRERLPYAVAVVELDEGPRMLTRLVDAEVGSLSVGQPVEVSFTPVADGVVLPNFRPAGKTAARGEARL